MLNRQTYIRKMDGTNFSQPLILIREKCVSCGGTGVDTESAFSLAYDFQSRTNATPYKKIIEDLRCWECIGLGYLEEHKTFDEFENLIKDAKTEEIVEG